MARRRRDPRQARFLTVASLRWVVANRAWSWYHLVRYARFVRFRLRHPRVVTEGFVFLGRRIEVEVHEWAGQVVLGPWVHLGDRTKLRAHNGVLRLGEKVVLGSDNTVNAHLDIEIGAATLVSDWVYICDFDHRTSEPDRPIKDQGLVLSPVRIGAGTWVGTKVTVLRGSDVGAGSVLAAHAVVRGAAPPGSILAGVPARVVRRRPVDDG